MVTTKAIAASNGESNISPIAQASTSNKRLITSDTRVGMPWGLEKAVFRTCCSAQFLSIEELSITREGFFFLSRVLRARQPEPAQTTYRHQTQSGAAHRPRAARTRNPIPARAPQFVATPRAPPTHTFPQCPDPTIETLDSPPPAPMPQTSSTQTPPAPSVSTTRLACRISS